VNAAVIGSERARLLLADHLERLRQPAQRGERRAGSADEIDQVGERHGLAISRDSALECDSQPGPDRMTATPASRRLACARCGATFDCRLGGDCWCKTEPYRLPAADSTAEDCLCPVCLRKAAIATGRRAGDDTD
jgi:hypothetical protein